MYFREAKKEVPDWAVNQKAKLQQQAGKKSTVFQGQQKEQVSQKPDWAKNPQQLKTISRGATDETSTSEVIIDSQTAGEPVLPGPTESSFHSNYQSSTVSANHFRYTL